MNTCRKPVSIWEHDVFDLYIFLPVEKIESRTVSLVDKLVSLLSCMGFHGITMRSVLTSHNSSRQYLSSVLRGPSAAASALVASGRVSFLSVLVEDVYGKVLFVSPYQ